MSNVEQTRTSLISFYNRQKNLSTEDRSNKAILFNGILVQLVFIERNTFQRTNAYNYFPYRVGMQITQLPQNTDSDNDVEIVLTPIKDIMTTLHSIYNQGLAFPEQSIQFFLDNYFDLAKLVKVYYDRGDSLEDVMKLAKEREPVNIAMSREYDQSKMEAEFGWRTGYYGKYYEQHHVLAPNIAIYCYTPVFPQNNQMVHIINSIGLGFDNATQPDYQYYITGNRLEEVESTYRDKIFAKIYHCAREHRLNTIVMNLIGTSSFGSGYPNILDMWTRMFVEFLRKTNTNGIITKFMGSFGTNAREMIEHMLSEQERQLYFGNSTIEDIGRFPQDINRVDTEQTLFVNAWDPWSFAGNGNEGDPSLDGYIGRATAIGVLTTPLVNVYLTDKNAYIQS